MGIRIYIKGVFRRRKLKDRPYYDRNKTRKTMVHKTLQKTLSNTNPTNNRGEIGFIGRVNNSCSTSGIRRVSVKRHSHYVICKTVLID